MPASKVVALNNSAVTSLLRGRPKKALALLSAATAILKDHFAGTNVQERSRSSFNETPLPHRQSQLPRFISKASTQQHQSNLSSSPYSLPSDDEGNEYSSAMEINAEQDQPSVLSFRVRTSSLSQDVPLILNYSRALAIVDGVEDKDLLAGVVLYNMALVNHCRAIELGISSLLSNSLSLYKMAASVLERSSDVDASNELVLLALYNNMAQIHAYQWSSPEVRVCVDNIRILLSTVSAEKSFVSQEDFRFFCVSTMLHVEDINIAPAA
jgi:hypothetical protein